MAKIVWQSKITSDMVKGWSQEKVDELTDQLDDAVERIFEELESEFDEVFDPEEFDTEEDED